MNVVKSIKKQLSDIPSLPGVYPHTKQTKLTSKFKLSIGVIKSLKKLDSLGHGVGVYFFKDARGRIIYIGKAVDLKARVKSYFIKNSLYGIKVAMLPEIAKIDYKTTETEIDALILESQLIKKHRPKYNVLLKDDKNYFYVVFTSEQFPKIFITHQPHKIRNSLSSPVSSTRASPRMRGSRSKSNLDSPDFRSRGNDTVHRSDLFYIGPYTDGQALKTTLRYLRKIFPYCTCKNQHKVPCLKSHLGLCPGICCVYSTNNSRLATFNKEIKIYKKNIKSITDILSGKRKNILKKMEKEMKTVAKNEDFENAAKLRDKISAMENIFQHKINDVGRHYGRPTSLERAKSELDRIFGAKIGRIEFYDISNISGQLAVGSMAVFDNGKANKSHYRKFKIKTVFESDDPAMMREVLERRLKHKEWPMPDLIIVDGGIAQFNVARKILKNTNILCASLAKNPDRLFFCLTSDVKQLALKNLSENTILLLQNLRDEAHRFAISYHRKLRSRKLKNEFADFVCEWNE